MKHSWLVLTIIPAIIYADMGEGESEKKIPLPSYEKLAEQSLRERAAELSALLQSEEKEEAVTLVNDLAQEEKSAPAIEEEGAPADNELADALEVQAVKQKRSPLRSTQKREQRTTIPENEKPEQLKPAHEALTPKRKESVKAQVEKKEETVASDEPTQEKTLSN